MLNVAAAPTRFCPEVILVYDLEFTAVPVILIAVITPEPSTESIVTVASLAGLCPPKFVPAITKVSDALYPEPALTSVTP